jgi:hypothetical protein
MGATGLPRLKMPRACPVRSLRWPLGREHQQQVGRAEFAIGVPSPDSWRSVFKGKAFSTWERQLPRPPSAERRWVEDGEFCCAFGELSQIAARFIDINDALKPMAHRWLDVLLS